MGSERKIALEAAVDAVRRRWGRDSLRPMDEVTPAADIPCIPSGFPALDQALGIGGIPRGRITEVVGVPTSGATTLALRTIAHAQASGDAAAFVDFGQTLDPDYAARCGVDVERLLMIWPEPARDGLDIARDLVTRGGAGIVVIGLAVEQPQGEDRARVLAARLQWLAGAAVRSGCALILLNRSGNLTLGVSGALRLQVEPCGWLFDGRDVRGYEAQVTVLRNPFAPEGRTVPIAITFDSLVKGDGA